MSALADYRKLTGSDFLASRFGVFGMLHPQKILLARRPLKRFFLLGRARLRCLDIEALTTQRGGVRGAVEVRIRYFTIWGREIKQAEQTQLLFADPVNNAGLQRIWLSGRKGGPLALFSIARTSNGAPVGITSSFQLKHHSVDVEDVAVAEILRCRDELLLLSAYEKAEDDGAPERALRILARLAFLWQKPSTQRAMTYIRDVRQLVAHGFKVKGVKALVGHAGSGTYKYVSLFAAVKGSDVLLSRKIAYEAQRLAVEMQKSGSDTVEVAEGSDLLIRLIVAYNLGVKISVQTTHMGTLPLWVSEVEAAEFVETVKKLH
ncbi:hypothetical protein [Kordiimonas pumila]|uniref:Uncharacterized protein n=1 Tax=Kordiimonas pumila TaxID=2161677 RepID=A0ABV7D4X5_9PROT|nr:hypothetical protein [Kordiimonas pumila]